MLPEFDIVVVGAGCAGWQLLYQLSLQPNFSSNRVLLLDNGDAKQQSWCFWSAQDHPLQHLVTKSWLELTFRGAGFLTTQTAEPYAYHYIPGKAFFNYFEQEFLPNHPNITLIKDEVSQI